MGRCYFQISKHVWFPLPEAEAVMLGLCLLLELLPQLPSPLWVLPMVFILPFLSASQIFRPLINTFACIHNLAGQAHLLLLVGFFCICGAQKEILNSGINEDLVF